MPPVREKVTSRLFSFGWDRWNHRKRAICSIPIWYAVGYAIGLLGGVHLVPSGVADEFVAVLFGAAAILLGTAVLAAVD